MSFIGKKKDKNILEIIAKEHDTYKHRGQEGLDEVQTCFSILFYRIILDEAYTD